MVLWSAVMEVMKEDVGNQNQFKLKYYIAKEFFFKKRHAIDNLYVYFLHMTITYSK